MYHKNWKSIAFDLKQRKGWKCEVCTAAHSNQLGKRLQVHHRDYNPENNREGNLIVVCGGCHLNYHKYRKGSITPGQLTLDLVGQ